MADLITSDRGFEIAKFQAVVFSVVIGLSLLYHGATIPDAASFSKFAIDEAYEIASHKAKLEPALPS